MVVKGLSAVLWCGKKYIHFRPNLFEAYIHPQPRYHLACIIYDSFQSTNIFQIATRRGKCSPSSNFLVRPAPPPEIVWSLTLDPLQIHAKYHQNDPKNLGYHHLLSCFASKLAEFRIAWSALEQSLCGAEPSPKDDLSHDTTISLRWWWGGNQWFDMAKTGLVSWKSWGFKMVWRGKIIPITWPWMEKVPNSWRKPLPICKPAPLLGA